MPKGGAFSPKDVGVAERAAKYDLIVTVDTPSLDMLGVLYAQNAEAFLGAVKINIDSHIANENFGDVQTWWTLSQRQRQRSCTKF